MKFKNLTSRNVSILAQHKPGGMPYRVKVIANSTLELDDEAEYPQITTPAKALVKAGVLKVVVAPVSKLTKSEIISKVSKEAEVELKDTLSKTELQTKAEALGVEV